jgi:hypothetical protein
MTIKNESVQELGEAPDLSMDEFLRITVAQMFENDNDTSYLNAKLKATDGTESELEFKLRLVSINGILTRDEDDD